MTTPTGLRRGRPLRPDRIPEGDAGDAYDPKPAVETFCECGVKYPLGSTCGYCRAKRKAALVDLVKQREPAAKLSA